MLISQECMTTQMLFSCKEDSEMLTQESSEMLISLERNTC